MKKFISMVMAAAMVVSLVPATAFAADSATFKVVGDVEFTEDAADKTTPITGPELQIKVQDVDTKKAGITDNWEITLDFENAEFKNAITDNTADGVINTFASSNGVTIAVKEDVDAADDSITLVLTEKDDDLAEDEIIWISLADLGLVLTKDSAGTEATVTVSGDFGDSDALVFASVLEEGVSVTLKDTADVAVEETTTLKKDLKIEANVGTFFAGQIIELKLNSGFEWDLTSAQLSNLKNTYAELNSTVVVDEDVLTLKVNGTPSKITIDKDDLGIEAVSAKVGDVAKITVKVKEGDSTAPQAWKATAEAVEAAVVVGDTVTMSVDADEDVPVIYSGVNVDNYGITDDSKHKALTVTLEESVKEALDTKKAFTLTLTEGVFVTDVDVEAETLGGIAASNEAIEDLFRAAYEKGEYNTFEFKRKAFSDSTAPRIIK